MGIYEMSKTHRLLFNFFGSINIMKLLGIIPMLKTSER